jgi:hypothetical protein
MTILYILIAVLVGWVIGFLDSNLRTAKKIEAAEANAKLKIAQAEQKFATSSNLQDDPGLLRLKRNEGRYTLEMDGAPVTSDLSHDKRRRLVELLTVFRLWLEGGQSSPSAPTTPAPDSAQDAFPRPAQSSLKPAVLPKKPEPEKNILSLSIVQQIDTVLQAQLADTPLAKRGVRLQESIQGGVEVYVGLQKFLEVDDVPDETIKAAIRAAIAEWENKFTPGF